MLKIFLLMLQLILSGLVAQAALQIQELPDGFIERFDDYSQGQLKNGAAIEPDAGIEKGALAAVGDGSSNQVVYITSFKTVPGEKYAFGINYKTTPKAYGNSFIVQAVFLNKQGKAAAPTKYFKFPCNPAGFSYKMGEFIIPSDTYICQLMLRLLAPKAEKIWMDNLRIGKIREDGTARFIHMDNFETTFDQWSLDRHLIFERFGIGNGGKIINEWKEAKVGEAFFECRGSDEPMQYSLMIRDLNVKASRNYIFEAFYKATDDFKFHGHGILIFFQKDKDGKPIGQTRFHIQKTDGEWKPLVHTLTTLPDCTAIDIGLNTRNMTKDEYIRLDHLRFKEGQGNLSFTFEIDPDQHILNCTAAPFGFANLQGTPQITMKLNDEKGKNIVSRNLIAAQEDKLNLNDIPDGYYLISAEMTLDGGKKFSVLPQKIAICKNPAWLNDIGIAKPDAPPPAPWSKLKYSENEITTWNDTFKFNNSVLFENISSLFRAAPSLSINGAPVVPGKFKWTKKTDKASATFPVSGANWQGNCTVSIDYSGFYHFKMELMAENESFKLESSKLVMSLKELECLYRSDDSWSNIGAIDLKKNPIWSTKHFYNELQFGTINSGIVWYAPSLYPEQSDFSKTWIQVDAKSGKIEIELINTPLMLKGKNSRTLEFAIAPYPFRPGRDYWKSLRFRAGKYSNLDLVWQESPLFKTCGSTAEAAKGDEIKKLLAAKGDKKWLFYQFPFYIMDTIPEWSYFKKHWKAAPSRAYDFRKSFGGMAFKGDIRKRTWQDYYLLKLREHLQEFPWDGVYYDCFGTDLFTEDGRQFHPTFEVRDFQERIYRTQREKNPDSLTITHLGGAQFNTAGAFSDLVLMGEQYRAQFMKHEYFTEFLTLDEFRYENAINIGPDRMMLPQYRRKDQIDSKKHTVHVLGICLLHNLMIYPNFIRKDVELNIREKLYSFGLEKSTFNPYWQTEAVSVKVNNPAVKISYFENENGYFAIVFNPGKKSEKFRFEFPESINKTIGYDAVANQQFDVKQDFILEPHMAVFGIFYKKH